MEAERVVAVACDGRIEVLWRDGPTAAFWLRRSGAKEDREIGPYLLLEQVDPRDVEEALGVPAVDWHGWLRSEVSRKTSLALMPDPLPVILAYLGHYVREDEVTGLAVFLAGLSAYVDPLNLALLGPKSVGKTYTAIMALSLLPEEDVWWLGGMSPTALVHERGRLEDSSGQPVDPALLRELRRRSKEAYYEVVAGLRTVVDLDGKVLLFLEPPHLETFNRLKPLLSHDRREIVWKFADRPRGGSLRTQTVVLRGWPVAIFCSEQPLNYLETRTLTLTPKMGGHKYQAAGEKIGLEAGYPEEFDNPELRLLRDTIRRYVGWLRDEFEKGLRVRVLFGPIVAKAYGMRFPRDMRDLGKLLILVKIFAALRANQRPVVMEGDGASSILATFQDYVDAVELFQRVYESTFAGVAEDVLRFYWDILKPLAEEGQEDVGYDEIGDRYFEVRGERISSDRIRKRYIRPLLAAGYVDRREDPEDRRRALIHIWLPDQIGGRRRRLSASEILEEFSLDEALGRLRRYHPRMRVVVGINDHRNIENSEFVRQFFSGFPERSAIAEAPKLSAPDNCRFFSRKGERRAGFADSELKATPPPSRPSPQPEPPEAPAARTREWIDVCPSCLGDLSGHPGAVILKRESVSGGVCELCGERESTTRVLVEYVDDGRVVVRILEEVESFVVGVGEDGSLRTAGPFSPGRVVRLPREVARVLIQTGKAEPLLPGGEVGGVNP